MAGSANADPGPEVFRDESYVELPIPGRRPSSTWVSADEARERLQRVARRRRVLADPSIGDQVLQHLRHLQQSRPLLEIQLVRFTADHFGLSEADVRGLIARPTPPDPPPVDRAAEASGSGR